MPPNCIVVTVLILENLGTSDLCFVAFVVYKSTPSLHFVRGEYLSERNLDATGGLKTLFLFLLTALLELDLRSGVDTSSLVGIVAFSFLEK